MYLPIGISNFRELIEYKDPQGVGYLFVDKTELIKEMLYDLTKVMVFTRPRRFGKTLNLSMLHHVYALNVDGNITKGLFDHLKIAQDPVCMQQQGQHPVIFISFKDIKQPNFEFCIAKIKAVVAETYRNYRKELESNKIAKDDQNYINTILEQTVDQVKTKEWYNGYIFGGTTIYNPCSIVEFIKEDGRLKAYWVNTSSNDLAKNLLINSSSNIKNSIELLIAGHIVREYVDEHVVFSDLKNNPGALWSLLLMSGYLKYISCEDQDRGYICDLSLPNNEIASFYISAIREWLSGDRGFVWYQEFLSNLENGRVEEFESKLQTLIDETLSFRDVSKKSQESFYQGLILGFVSGFKDTHWISSNKESGKGLYDVAIIPKDLSKLGIIMEFKAIDDESKLEETAMNALLQIKKAKYTSELKARGINNICSMGIAFSGKKIKIMGECY